jgi:hypothetical protein
MSPRQTGKTNVITEWDRLFSQTNPIFSSVAELPLV